MNTFNFIAVEEGQMTKGEAAEFLYPGVTYDCALPQAFVDKLEARGFTNVAAHFISLYPEEGIAHSAPITATGVKIAAIVASYS